MDGYHVDGAKLRGLRERLGFRRTELARAANVSLAHLKYVEAGEKKPSVVLVWRVANALGVDPTDFCVADDRPAAVG